MNLKQTLFVSYYTEGDTKGNCEQSMLKAGYKAGYARKNGSWFLRSIKGMKKAIDDKLKAIQIAWEDRITKVITRLQTEIDKTTSPSTLCLLINAQKGYMDMQAKNEGKYGADNAQKTEQAALTEEQQKTAKEFAKWKLLRGLSEPESKERAG